MNAIMRGLAVACLGACGISHALPDQDNIYYGGSDEPQVVCASNIDDKYHITDDEIAGGLDRARHHGQTIHVYAHDPGVTLAIAELKSLLSMARDRDMPFVTYSELGTGGANGSIALSFDDNAVADWTAIRPLLQMYGAHVTFFVTRYLVMTDDEHAQLQALAADGHDVEYHTVSHQNAVDYVAAHGIAGYLADEITPGLDAMKADGYPITSFAYPFGARDDELDAALSPLFAHIRAIASTCPN